jgi:hypothetical protein
MGTNDWQFIQLIDACFAVRFRCKETESPGPVRRYDDLMATAAIEQPKPAGNETAPVLLYIIAPLMLWTVRWLLLASVVKAPVEQLIVEVQKLIASTLFAFLLALYASRVRQSRDWRAFSRWFGAFALLNPIVQPMSFALFMFEIFEIAKRRVRARPVPTNS